jgi:two-component system, response regulator PdtaR
MDKILIVEDDTIVAFCIQNLLKQLGYDVVGRASTGEDAIEKAKELRPDLVLMDIHLKGPIDGIQTAETVYGVYNIPVIYLTAFSDEKTLERAQKTSPFGYIVKPFTDDTLRTTVKMALLKDRSDKEKRKIVRGHLWDEWDEQSGLEG